MRASAFCAGGGKTVEWRKWNTLEDAGALTEQDIDELRAFLDRQTH